jgi:hypothetical protein
MCIFQWTHTRTPKHICTDPSTYVSKYIRKCMYPRAHSHACIHTLPNIHTRTYMHIHAYTWIYIYVCGEGCGYSGRPGRQISGFRMAHMPHNASTCTAIQHTAPNTFATLPDVTRTGARKTREKKRHAPVPVCRAEQRFLGALEKWETSVLGLQQSTTKNHLHRRRRVQMLVVFCCFVLTLPCSAMTARNNAKRCELPSSRAYARPSGLRLFLFYAVGERLSFFLFFSLSLVGAETFCLARKAQGKKKGGKKRKRVGGLLSCVWLCWCGVCVCVCVTGILLPGLFVGLFVGRTCS